MMALDAKTVLSKAFGEALTNLDAKPLGLSGPVSVLIADDSDDHRSRSGWMRYDTLHEAQVGSRTYVLGLGESEGDYPAEPYRSDILVFCYQERPEDLTERVGTDIKQAAMFFDRSFLVAMTHEGLALPRTTRYSLWWEWPSGKPDLSPWERLKAHVETFGEADRESFAAATGRPVVTRNPSYKESAVAFVREALLACLAQRDRAHFG